MTAFIIRRIIQSFFLLIGISAVAFFIQRLAPGGPEQFLQDPRLPPEYWAEQRKDMGLDQPLPIQYAKWLRNAVQLDFGRSFQDRRPAMDKIAERAPNTFILSGASLLVGLLGVPMGIIAALRRGGWFDHGLRLFTVVGNAMPHWWLGLVILLVSARTINIFPIGGMYSVGDGGILDRLHHLALPAMIGGLAGWLTFSRFMRSEVLEVISQDYIRTARAKGLREQTVIWKHMLRNALIVVVTILGGSLAALLSGSVLFENVFSWPGMGRLAIDAAFQRDYPVLMALVMIGASLVILGNFLADIAYGFIDPRIRYS